MSLAIHGLAVSRGVAIGRAVVIASNRAHVAHYFIDPSQTEAEIRRVRQARDEVVQEIASMLEEMPADAPPELSSLVEVHLMLLEDKELEAGVKQWIAERHYNAEWALTAQMEVLARQFDDMQDEYLRERKGDLEQVVEHILRQMHANKVAHPQAHGSGALAASAAASLFHNANAQPRDDNLILVAHELSPADMLQFKRSVFNGFITDVGGPTAHTAIVARSMDIAAVVGARSASQFIRQDDWVIIDGDAGIAIIDPSPMLLDEYRYKQKQGVVERERLSRLRHTPAVTMDGQFIELLANIEQPQDSEQALQLGALGVGLFRSEFLFMGRGGQLPDEEEQYQAYAQAVQGMKGLPVTIRTVDVGADKALDERHLHEQAHLNPALGLRAIRWCLTEPTMFITQIKAILRAAALGPVHLLIPMLAHAAEIHKTLALIQQTQVQLQAAGVPQGPVQLGAMIEVPAAALCLPMFLQHFDFLSIGTNDLTQYTLAIDRSDQAVAHLYDPLHPAVLQLIASTIQTGQKAGKGVTVCGEMAGDPRLTGLLLGLGLRSFSMHPTQLLSVKQEILRSDTQKLKAFADQFLQAEDPAALLP